MAHASSELGPPTDATLDLAIAGNEAAFASVYRAVQPRLVRYATTLVGGDAEDVVAEVWVQIARDLHTFSGSLDNFRGWAATITRHRSLDLLRARKRRPAVASDLSELNDPPAAEETEDVMMQRMQTSRAIGLISSLPQGQAEAVMLRAVLGLDVPAAAAILGKNPTAVRVAAHRGLQKLTELAAADRATADDAVITHTASNNPATTTAAAGSAPTAVAGTTGTAAGMTAETRPSVSKPVARRAVVPDSAGPSWAIAGGPAAAAQYPQPSAPTASVRVGHPTEVVDVRHAPAPRMECNGIRPAGAEQV